MSDLTTTWADLKKEAGASAEMLAAQAPISAEADPVQRVTRRWLELCGIPEKYAERYDPAEVMHDAPSEDLFLAWLTDLPRMLVDGGWLTLGGAVGTRKSFALCRLADFCQVIKINPQRAWWMTPNDHLTPRALHPGSEIMYCFAPAIAQSLLDWDGDCHDEPSYMTPLLKTRILMVDDVDRWDELKAGDFQLGKVRHKWDTLTEYRDAPGLVTVATANKWASEMYKEPGYRRWIDRARERGSCIEIQGESTRPDRNGEMT